MCLHVCARVGMGDMPGIPHLPLIFRMARHFLWHLIFVFVDCIFVHGLSSFLGMMLQFEMVTSQLPYGWEDVNVVEGVYQRQPVLWNARLLH